MAGGKHENTMPIVIEDNDTGNNQSSDKTYTVSGNGVVLVSAGSLSGGEQDYGQWTAYVYHNGTLIFGEGTRWGTNATTKFGASVCVPVSVSNGDTIRVAMTNTKNAHPSKLYYRRFLCFGCSVS